MTTDTKKSPPVIDSEVVDFPNTEAALVPTAESSFLTYGTAAPQALNLVRIGKPKSIEANHPEVEDCCFWRYPTADQPLYMPFRYPNGKPQNKLNVQLVAIEETVVSYNDSP